MSKKHIHKYHKIDVNSVDVWACALPECNHHMPKHYEKMVVGKASICWGCGDFLVLSEANMSMNKPECFKCLHPELEVVVKVAEHKESEIPLEERLNKLFAEK